MTPVRQRLLKMQAELQLALKDATDNYGYDPAGGPLIGPLSLLLTLVTMTLEVEQVPTKVKDMAILCEAYEDYMMSLWPKPPPPPERPNVKQIQTMDGVSPAMKEEIIKLYNNREGDTIEAIVEKTGLTRWIVRNVLIAGGLDVSPRDRKTDEQKQQIRDLYAQGYHISKIAKTLGITHVTVGRILRIEGLREQKKRPKEDQ